MRLGPDLYVFAGRDWRIVSVTRARILDAFAWVAAGAAIIAAIAGWFLGSKFMQRVDDIARTCESIIGGQLSERIALRGRGDEWDRLAGAINDMLNRIALLLENLQQVSSDVAHDLRSPLTRLRNRLEAARSGSTTASEYAAAVSRALEDTDQLLAIFSALLRISQVEAGTRAGAFSDVSLSDVVQRLYEMYRPVAEDYQHELECDIRRGIHVRGDSELLIQMFSNLIENAIRHTPSRSRIRISLEPVEDRAVVVVRDNGEGIPRDEYAKVTRRFYRVSTSRTTSGHGLGLALVAAIAELHHAVLLFADEEPGLAVSVKFPFAREAMSDDQRSPASGALVLRGLLHEYSHRAGADAIALAGVGRGRVLLDPIGRQQEDPSGVRIERHGAGGGLRRDFGHRDVTIGTRFPDHGQRAGSIGAQYPAALGIEAERIAPAADR